MPQQKPTQYLQWDPTGSNSVQPPDTLRARGYQQNESPVAEHFNWELALLDNWVQYLDSSVGSALMTTTLDTSMRLLGGGTITFSLNTGALSWSQPFNISIPSVSDSDNQIAAGNVILQPGQVAYVQANYPFTSAGDVSLGTASIRNVAYTNGIAPGQAVTGSGISSGTTVINVSGSTVTLSQNATASAQQTPVTYAGTGPLTMQASSVATLVPSANTIVLARAAASNILLGLNSGQVILRDGEQRRLLEAGYHDVRYLAAGEALSSTQAVHISTGTSGRTQGAAYRCDASSALGSTRSICVGFATGSAPVGATASVMTGGVLGGFSGLSQGAIYYCDPSSLGGITLTRPTGANYVVPVGIALDANTLYVRIASASGAPSLDPTLNSLTVQAVTGDTNTVQLVVRDAAGNSKLTADNAGNVTAASTVTATSVVSSIGFRSSLSPAMIQYSVSANTTPGANGNSPLNMAETNNFANWTLKLPFAGSITGVSVSFRFTAAQSTAPSLGFYINKNNTAGGGGFYSPSFTAASASANSDFPYAEAQAKGKYPFAAGDTLTMQWYSGTQFSAACTLYIKVALYVEFTS